MAYGIMEHSELDDSEKCETFSSTRHGVYNLDEKIGFKYGSHPVVLNDAVPSVLEHSLISRRSYSNSVSTLLLRVPRESSETLVSRKLDAATSSHEDDRDKAQRRSRRISALEKSKLGGSRQLQVTASNSPMNQHTRQTSTQFDLVQSSQRASRVTMNVNVFAATSQAKPTKQKKRYTITNSRKPLSDVNMEMLSTQLGNHWKRLARKLGLHEGDVDRLEYDNRSSGLREVIWKMLYEWREVRGDAATLCVLADALIELKLYDIAALLKERG